MKVATAGLVAALLAARAVHADTPSEYTLKVTSQQLIILSRALGAMPYNDVAELVASLQKQITEQQNASKPKAPPSK